SRRVINRHVWSAMGIFQATAMNGKCGSAKFRLRHWILRSGHCYRSGSSLLYARDSLSVLRGRRELWLKLLHALLLVAKALHRMSNYGASSNFSHSSRLPRNTDSE